jgi:AcrR family transcriptional regulator
MVGPDTTLRARKKLRTRESIADAAMTLFDERGFDEVTVTDIAARADVGRSTFFRYFTDKREVLFDDGGESLAALVDASRSAAETLAPIGDSLTAALVVARAGLVALADHIGADTARLALRAKLIEQYPELHARNLVKERTYLTAGIEIMLQAGASPDTATLAAHLGLACFVAAHNISRGGEGFLIDAIDQEFRRLGTVDVAVLTALRRAGR